MRLLHFAVVLVAFALVGCGDAAASGSSAAETPPPPTQDVAIVIPEAEDGRVAAGTIVEVIYPGGESRGFRHFLQHWDGQTWSDVYQIAISDPHQPFDQERTANAWAPADEDSRSKTSGSTARREANSRSSRHRRSPAPTGSVVTSRTRRAAQPSRSPADAE